MNIKTEVKEVHIYRNRCTVIRKGMIPLKAGLNHVVISGMSTSAMIDTVRMSFPSSVKAVMIRVIEGKNGRETKELSGKIRRIELKKKALREQAEMWKPEGGFRFIKDMSVSEMEACISAYPLRMEAIENKIHNLDREQASLEKQLRQAVEKERRPYVQAELVSESDMQCFVEMKYQDGNAGWYPKYEIHADKKNSNSVRFIVKANVFQNTSEDWKQVKISVHPGNPVLLRSIPKPDPVYLSIRSDETISSASGTMPAPVIENTTGQWEIDTVFTSSFSLKALDMDHAERNVERPAAGYSLPSVYTVRSGYGEGFSCELSEFSVHAEYTIKAVPKQSTYGYLCAQLKRDDIHVMPGGWADVYLDGTYTANIYLENCFGDESLTVPLGVMEGISVNRQERKKKDSGAVIRNLRSCVYEININVSNHEEKNISLEIMDRIPVSKDREIHVELLECGHASYDAEDGTLCWKLDLKPRQNKSVHAQYRILQPKEKEIERSSISSPE